MEDDDVVFIKVRRSTREELKGYGIKGDTYEVIIRRLIRCYQNERAKKKGGELKE
jgi:hypothetical protein